MATYTSPLLLHALKNDERDEEDKQKETNRGVSGMKSEAFVQQRERLLEISCAFQSSTNERNEANLAVDR